MVDGSSTEGHFWQAGLGKSVIANEKSFHTRTEEKEDDSNLHSKICRAYL